MTIDVLRNALLYCAIINYAILIVWYLFVLAPHGWMLTLMGKNVRLSHEQFDTILVKGMTLYKLAIFLFNLVPYIALRIAA